MGKFLDFLGWPSSPPEQRMITSIAGIERPGYEWTGVVSMSEITLPSVTIDSALTVPAVWGATTFLSRTLGNLEIHLMRDGDEASERISGGLATLIEEAPNPEWDSFRLREYFWTQVFTGGRGLLWIERSGSNIVGLWPINPVNATIKRDPMGRTTYEVGGKIYPAADVIDVPFMLKSDGLGHYGPITMGAKAIQLAMAMGDYGAKFFAGGGVPPLALEGPLPQGAEAFKRAMADITRAIDNAKAQDKPIFPMPPGHKLSPVGFDPDKGQMTEARRFIVEEIARIYGLPPWFLQDLTNANFANSENQDLALTKHVIAPWANKFEKQLNLKLFGQRNNRRYVRHNVDTLLRGDFKARAEAVASLVQCAVYTPAQGAEYMGQPTPTEPEASKRYMQGAMVPLGYVPEQKAAPVTPDQGNADGV
jgi:HK97 family phage portal protein